MRNVDCQILFEKYLESNWCSVASPFHARLNVCLKSFCFVSLKLQDLWNKFDIDLSNRYYQ